METRVGLRSDRINPDSLEILLNRARTTTLATRNKHTMRTDQGHFQSKSRRPQVNQYDILDLNDKRKIPLFYRQVISIENFRGEGRLIIVTQLLF